MRRATVPRTTMLRATVMMPMCAVLLAAGCGNSGGAGGSGGGLLDVVGDGISFGGGGLPDTEGAGDGHPGLGVDGAHGLQDGKGAGKLKDGAGGQKDGKGAGKDGTGSGKDGNAGPNDGSGGGIDGEGSDSAGGTKDAGSDGAGTDAAVDDTAVDAGPKDPCLANPCDDKNPCTDDLCEPFTGKCAHVAKHCPGSGPCQVGACDPQTGACTLTKKADCCEADGDCKPTAACQLGTCDKATGTCKFAAKDGCCTSGVCCDIAKQAPKAAGTKCGNAPTSVQWKCEGNAAMRQEVFAGCDGKSAAACSSDGKHSHKAGWTVFAKCASGTQCTLKSSGTAPMCEQATPKCGSVGIFTCKGGCYYYNGWPCQCDKWCGHPMFQDCCKDYKDCGCG